jgi:hypothetical protein
VSHPAEEADLIGLESHPRTPTEAEPTASQLGRDVLDGDREAGRKSLDDDHQGPSM